MSSTNNKTIPRGWVGDRLPLLMTASVSTRGMKGACFTDEEREEMYISALTYYIECLIQKNDRYSIVFAENSGWDLQRIRRRMPVCDELRIEYIALPPDEFNVSKGKGYNELLLITKALERSELLKKAGGFFKVTGRYPIFNIRRFVDKASTFINEEGGDLYADVKDHSLFDWLRLGWCGHSFDCRLYGVRTDYYKSEIWPLYVKCDDDKGCFLEDVFFDFVKQGRGKISQRFDREPHFGGLEGSDIDAFSFCKEQDSLKGKTKRWVGNIIRVLMPWFKF